jgi:hypothetical protein
MGAKGRERRRGKMRRKKMEGFWNVVWGVVGVVASKGEEK